jgi:GH15 family glucan-1,4-alpha-glucosidase
LALDGRVEQAKSMFERLLALQNDVGLLAEEYEPRAKRQLGNFPQALSHLSLVTTALNFARGAKPSEQRPESVTVPPAEGS